jgi:hypothetical protein
MAAPFEAVSRHFPAPDCYKLLCALAALKGG